MNHKLSLRLWAYALAVTGTIALAGCNDIPGSTFESVGARLDAGHEARAPGFEPNTAEFAPIIENPFLLARDNPLSTFSADVNTASYSKVREYLRRGTMPPKDAVRLAELINYFDYDYPEPDAGEPVGIRLELAACPWRPDHKLLRAAVKAKSLAGSELGPRNFCLLVDVSGSMGGGNRLPLAKRAFGMLVERLTARDRVSVVAYAGSARVVLEPTPGDRRDAIRAAIDGLLAGGSTAGGDGLRMAYDLVQRGFDPEAINRVLLATDGDFNVGPSSNAEMVRLVTERRKAGIYLTLLGFGMSNHNDSKMELMARHGDGHYAFIGDEEEARKVFVDEGAALVTVAKDVKFQVEFNPARVEAYRLIGYENRLLRDEDFNDDAKDAGDMGSGQRVTALYQIVPAGGDVPRRPKVDPLKYQKRPAVKPAGEWLTVKMRYKSPAGGASKLIAVPLPPGSETNGPSADFRFAAAVAEFGLLLRDSEYKGDADWRHVIDAARPVAGGDRRSEFVRLVGLASRLPREER